MDVVTFPSNIFDSNRYFAAPCACVCVCVLPLHFCVCDVAV